MTFALTPKQNEAQGILASAAQNILLEGGSRSGKTFLLCRAVAMRAIKAPGSRHGIFRFRFNAVKTAVALDTFPRMMALCFPGVPWEMDKTDWYAKLPGGSEVWFSGLDDDQRVEKVLGKEFATLYANEASQITWGSIGVLMTRLAQQVEQKIGGTVRPLIPRFYCDANPPTKAHWTYKLFHLKQDPETKITLRNQEDYIWFRMNPEDNKQNLAPGYLDTLQSLSARLQKRFLHGEYADATPNQLFNEDDIEKWRHDQSRPLPEFVRVVVGVDPSGSGDVDNADNDAIGIAVGAIGTDGNAYLLEDATVKAGPGTWGRVATSAFDRYQADTVVGEVNYGGEMVRQTILASRARTPFKAVTATRGKHVRAEPFSALYEQGKIRHVGSFPELESELAAFSTFGYLGEGSPNRADAWIWVLSELFPGLVRDKKAEVKRIIFPPRVGAYVG